MDSIIRKVNWLDKYGGYTLQELITVLAIIALLAGLAIPNMSGWMGKRDLDTSAREMLANFQIARGTAITTNKNVTIQVNASPDWYQIQDADGKIIIPRTYFPKGISITAVAGFPLTFTPRGYSNSVSAAKVTIQSSRIKAGNIRSVTLNPGGAASIEP